MPGRTLKSEYYPENVEEGATSKVILLKKAYFNKPTIKEHGSVCYNLCADQQILGGLCEIVLDRGCGTSRSPCIKMQTHHDAIETAVPHLRRLVSAVF